MTFHPYERCSSCQGSAKPGTRYVMEALIAKYPYTSSLGIYSCRNVGGTGTMSIHSCGRAFDLKIPTLPTGRADVALGHPPLMDLIATAWELGNHGLIYNRIRYDRGDPLGAYYGGVHPHYDHIHGEQTDHHARTLSRETVFTVLDVTGREYLTMLAPCQHGDRGDHVAALQVMLTASGFNAGAADGVYGDATAAAVLAMRKSRGSSATSGNVFDKYGHEQLLAAHAVKVIGAGSAPDLSGYYTKTESDTRFVNIGEAVKLVK